MHGRARRACEAVRDSTEGGKGVDQELWEFGQTVRGKVQRYSHADDHGVEEVHQKCKKRMPDHSLEATEDEDRTEDKEDCTEDKED